MTAVRSIPAHAPTSVPPRVGRLRAVGTTIAKRLMLDRQIEFWLSEIRPAWSIDELRARVVAVIDETHDVKTFVLVPNGAWPGHRAGQYVPVDVEIEGTRVRRCYSISSAPGSSRIAITVKRVGDGRVSSWMHDHVKRGDVLPLGAPAGDFVVAEGARPKMLLISGGSGVTPVMAILRDLAERDEVRDVVFVHCARSKRDVIFARDLESLAAEHAGLRVILRFDDDARGGRLDDAALRALVPDFAERETFLCGPEGMMTAVAKTWTDAGIADRLHVERFVARRSGSTESPRRTLPPCNTDAYTPTLARLCWAAARSIPTSLGRSPWGSVVITQRGQEPVIFRRTISPTATTFPIQASSAKARSPSGVCTTKLGRKRRASKRPWGYSSRNRSSVAVVSTWTTAVSKNVPSGSVKSVTVSLWSRPSISGQYSSALAVELSALEGAARSRRPRLAASNVTLRESARDRIWLISR